MKDSDWMISFGSKFKSLYLMFSMLRVKTSAPPFKILQVTGIRDCLVDKDMVDLQVKLV